MVPFLWKSTCEYMHEYKITSILSCGMDVFVLEQGWVITSDPINMDVFLYPNHDLNTVSPKFCKSKSSQLSEWWSKKVSVSFPPTMCCTVSNTQDPLQTVIMGWSKPNVCAWPLNCNLFSGGIFIVCGKVLIFAWDRHAFLTQAKCCGNKTTAPIHGNWITWMTWN